MCRISDITSDDIQAWAEQVTAPALLPALVRRLLLATAEVEQLNFRADGGTRIGGWDGIATLRAPSAHAPAGLSGWETTVEKARRKLDKDFEARAKVYRAGVEPLVGAYVAVTARRCGIRDEWVAEKKAAGPWADVRILDADNLATWLAVAPSVRAWFGPLVGKPLAEVTDLAGLAARWSKATPRPLPAELVLAGKERAALADQLRAWARGRTRDVLYVQAETREEAKLFIAVALSVPACEDIEARAMIVDTPEAWRWASTAQSLGGGILVPNFREFDDGAAASSAAVIVPVGPDVAVGGAKAIILPRLPHERVSAILVEHGWEGVEARRLTRDSGGKLAALQRLCGPYGRPAWASSLKPAEAAALLLVGTWAPANAADARALEGLGIGASTPEALCTALSQADGRPMESVKERSGPRCWRWAAEGEAWAIFARGLTLANLAAFRDVALAVLGADDPQYGMPPARRFYAGIEGKVLEHSDELREGLARSMVRLSVHDEVLTPTLGPGRGSGVARGLVRELLPPQWRRWASLSDVLPLLAEASPDQFLEQLDASLALADQGAAHLFAEESAMGSSPHTGLLWALEVLAWEKRVASRVAHVLARLAVADPPGEGKMANRPIRSLEQMLHPFVPQSASSAAERLAILGSIARAHGDIGWNLLLEPYDGGGFASSAARPQIVDWNLPPPLAYAAPEEAVAQRTGSLDLMLGLAKGRPERLAVLFEASRHLPPNLETRVIDAVAEMVRKKAEMDPDGIVWAALRRELYLFHLGGSTAGSEARKARVSSLHDELVPADLARALAWVFHPHPAIPEKCAGNLTESERRRGELQDDAMARVRAAPDAVGVLGRLCGLAEFPVLVGLALARSAWAPELLAKVVSPGRTVPEQAVPGLLAGTSDREGLDWLRSVLGDLLGQERKELVLRTLGLLSTRTKTWDLVDGLGAEVRRAYWTNINGAWGELSPAEHERAVVEFIAVDRPGLALQTASYAKDDLSPATALKVLEALRVGDHALIVREVGNSFDWHLAGVFERADEAGDDDAVGRLELFFFDQLDDSRRPPRHVYAALKAQPGLFVQMLTLIYRARDEGAPPAGADEKEPADPPEPSAEDVSRAEACYGILHSWRGYPGEDEATAEDRETTLLAWARNVLTLAMEQGRGGVAQTEVGAVLVRVLSCPLRRAPSS